MRIRRKMLYFFLSGRFPSPVFGLVTILPTKNKQIGKVASSDYYEEPGSLPVLVKCDSLLSQKSHRKPNSPDPTLSSCSF